MAGKGGSLTIGNEDTNVGDVTHGIEIDVLDRDPNNLNDVMKVEFADIIGEPHHTVFSFDKVFTISFKAFTNTKLWCYRITSLICAIPASVMWGVYFACLSFCTIWCCVPGIKAYEIELLCVRRLWESVLQTFLRPCYEAIGYIFYNIRVTKMTA